MKKIVFAVVCIVMLFNGCSLKGAGRKFVEANNLQHKVTHVCMDVVPPTMECPSSSTRLELNILPDIPPFYWTTTGCYWFGELDDPVPVNAVCYTYDIVKD